MGEPDFARRAALAGDHRAVKDDRIGIFRSWRALYVSVIAYTLALIGVLYLLTRLLDFSAP